MSSVQLSLQCHPPITPVTAVTFLKDWLLYGKLTDNCWIHRMDKLVRGLHICYKKWPFLSFQTCLKITCLNII